jgi:hypothetical protein
MRERESLDIFIEKNRETSTTQRDANMLMRIFQRMSERIEDALLKPVIMFGCNKQFGYYCDGVVRIGCQEHPIEYWVENYEEICKKLKAKKKDVEYCKIILNVLERDFHVNKKKE